MPGIAMGQKYNQLTLDERCRLRGMIEMELPKTEIARRLGRHRSTIDRELERNSNVDGYRPDTADRRAWARRLRGSKIERSTRLSAHIEDRLAMGWSPEQIAGRMELEGVEHGVCTESIYRHVFSPAGRRAGLPKLLAQRKSRRGRRARNGRRAPSIPNRTPISQRPKSAEDRQEFGHWEGDLMHFRSQRDILLTRQECCAPSSSGLNSQARRGIARKPICEGTRKRTLWSALVRARLDDGAPCDVEPVSGRAYGRQFAR